ncbi:MAG TPA: FecR family protein [candidate division Zixibacteria bacterium]|nr:FecR family protein [candidate division Zixibacteria bacterium]
MRKHAAGIITAAVIITAILSQVVMASGEVSVLKITGPVQYRISDGDWSPLSTDTKLGEGHSVRTGPDGEAVLTWFAGNVIKLSPLTMMKVDTLKKDEAGSNKSGIDIAEGRIYAKAAKLANDDSLFEVRTPTAIAGVRGTAFTVDHDATNRKSAFVVVEGRVVVTAQDVDQMVEPGHRVSVEINKPPTGPSRVREQEMNRLRREGKDIDKLVEESSEAGGEESSSLGGENAEEMADFVADDIIRQNLDNLIMEHITAPSGDCCNY